MNSGINMQEWLNGTVVAAKETITTMLRLDFTRLASTSKFAATDIAGAYISLTSESDSIQIGLLANRKDCQTLAKAMLGMEEEDEALSDMDVGDAIGEILNIIAGVVKRQLNHKVQNSIKLGLPKTVQGQLKPCNLKEMKEMNVLIGKIKANLLVIKVL